MTSKMNSNRKGAAAVYVEDVLFVFGGETVYTEIVHGYQYQQNALRQSLCKDFEKHPGGDKPWQIVGNLLTSRTFATAVAVKDKGYLIGGFIPGKEGRYLHQRSHFKQPCSTVEIFNTTSEKWSSSQNMNEGRADFGATVVNSRIYVVGGMNAVGGYITSTEFMDTENGAWTTITTTLPQNINSASICCVKNNIYLAARSCNAWLLKLDISSKKWNIEYQQTNVMGNIAPIAWKK